MHSTENVLNATELYDQNDKLYACFTASSTKTKTELCLPELTYEFL